MFGSKTLLVDGTKNQDYLVGGKRKIDDPEDPSPDDDPALWRHIAIAKAGKLYDAYNTNGLSMKRCDLVGTNGYFIDILKCYDVQKISSSCSCSSSCSSSSSSRARRGPELAAGMACRRRRGCVTGPPCLVA